MINQGNRIRLIDHCSCQLPFYYEPNLGAWLSVWEEVHEFGINGVVAANTFLRHIGNVAGSAAGLELLAPGLVFGKGFTPLLTWVTAAETGGSPNCTLELWSGLSTIWTATWNTTQQIWTPVTDLGGNGITGSMKIGAVTTSPEQPIVLIGCRWKRVD